VIGRRTVARGKGYVLRASRVAVALRLRIEIATCAIPERISMPNKERCASANAGPHISKLHTIKMSMYLFTLLEYLCRWRSMQFVRIFQYIVNYLFVTLG
jgi:hypothetical protein